MANIHPSEETKKNLQKLLDHGGNFNGGMVAEGLETFAQENPLIGAAAKSRSDNRLETDDATGQGIFNTGWQFAQQSDPNSILNWGK